MKILRRFVVLGLLLSCAAVQLHAHAHVDGSKQESAACQLCQTGFSAVDVPQNSISFQLVVSNLLIHAETFVVSNLSFYSFSPRAPPR